MAKFVFIHGSWLGAWCWRETAARLAARGHDAVAIDLPGHGADRSGPEAITFQDYVDRTILAVKASTDNPILVGHSMGGAIISQAAEFVPDRIRALVCVAALVPPDGSSMMKYVGEFDPEYVAQFVWAPDGRSAQLKPEGARRFLFSDCPADAIEDALPLLAIEPVAPYEAQLRLTEVNFARVPRYSIECLADRVVPIALQRSIRSAAGFNHVYSLDTGHAPFFSRPEELALMLHAIAERG
jgi:pimeloyl-ACP methyl ester carboxylesterase